MVTKTIYMNSCWLILYTLYCTLCNIAGQQGSPLSVYLWGKQRNHKGIMEQDVLSGCVHILYHYKHAKGEILCCKPVIAPKSLGKSNICIYTGVAAEVACWLDNQCFLGKEYAMGRPAFRLCMDLDNLICLCCYFLSTPICIIKLLKISSCAFLKLSALHLYE
jgi:hypothetical protein